MLENFNGIFGTNVPLLHIVLPLALSFVTFQQIAFLCDCFNSKVGAINPTSYALFICFFPQLIAGPIVHHKEMMPQFDALYKKDTIIKTAAAAGLFIFAIGLFKKLFIADTFGAWANAGYALLDAGATLSILESWALSLCYTLQIYFDFSGYCDMALGLGLLFGVRLPLNFNSPYKARNIADFWRRWHMTLGAFLKEYVYIPLGGNRLGRLLTLRNLFIVALLSGVWHGAGWGFVIWGAMHGSAMVIHRIYSIFKANLSARFALFKKICESKIYDLLSLLVTFLFINFAWVFFRATNLETAIALLKGMFNFQSIALPDFIAKYFHMTGTNFLIFNNFSSMISLTLFFVLALLVLRSKNTAQIALDSKPTLFLALFSGAFFALSLICLNAQNYAVDFLYFNF